MSDEYERQMKIFREIAENQKGFFKKKEGDSEKYSFNIRFDELRESRRWTLVQLKPFNKRVGDFDTMEELVTALLALSKDLK